MRQDEAIATLSGYEGQLQAILARFKKGRDGLWLAEGDHGLFIRICHELVDLFRDEFVDGDHMASSVVNFANESVRNYYGTPSYRGVENVLSFVTSAQTRVTRSPACLKAEATNAQMEPTAPERVEALYTIGRRFHFVAQQLRSRHGSRPTLDVTDEYDVQDAFHALLRLFFDDVRPEEWVPSYAGRASRMDFLLPEIESVIEIKKSRNGLGARELGEQLIIDIAKYAKHPTCRTLFCFVYDPEGRIQNPRGIENDLNASQAPMTVRVMIAP